MIKNCSYLSDFLYVQDMLPLLSYTCYIKWTSIFGHSVHLVIEDLKRCLRGNKFYSHQGWIVDSFIEVCFTINFNNVIKIPPLKQEFIQRVSVQNRLLGHQILKNVHMRLKFTGKTNFILAYAQNVHEGFSFCLQ